MSNLKGEGETTWVRGRGTASVNLKIRTQESGDLGGRAFWAGILEGDPSGRQEGMEEKKKGMS